MSADPFTVDELPDGSERYVLPRRPLGNFRYLGCVPLAIGLGFAGFAVFWTAGAAAAALAAPRGPMHWLGFAAVLWGCPFIAAGLVVMAMGAFVLVGHGEVRVGRGTLWAVERAGPFRWAGRRKLAQVRRFTVVRSVQQDDAPPVVFTDLGLLRAECEPGKPLSVAVGYPVATLKALAAKLGERCRVTTDAGELTAAPPVDEEVVVDPKKPGPRPDVDEQPAGSRAVVDERADGLTVTVPPAGVWRASKGVFGFALAWNGLLTLITAMMLLAIVAPGQVKFNGNPKEALPVMAAVLAIFWAVGIGLMLVSVNAGRRASAVAVVGGRLLVLQTGLFRTKRREWEPGAVTAVRVGPSGLVVNERPVLELQVVAKDGAAAGFLAGRDERELDWLATKLRRALGVGK